MFFVLSKILWFLLQPLVAAVALLWIGVIAALFRWHATAVIFGGAGLIFLTIVTLSPAGLIMMGVLENRFPKPTINKVDGIVVLGGSFDTRVASTRGEVELNEAGDRVTAAVALARTYPAARLLFTGGAGDLIAEDVSEAEAARKFFISMGMEADRVIYENKARNTVENAVYSKDLAQPKDGETWLLVTSAYHMPRAVGCFRSVGFDVVAYPVDYRTPSGKQIWWPSSTVSRNVEKFNFALREFMGLAAYWLTGKIDSFLPAPRADS